MNGPFWWDTYNVLASAGASAALLGNTSQAKETVSQFQNELEILHKIWGWLKYGHDAAVRMRNSISNNEMDKRLELIPNVYGPALNRALRFLEYAHAAYLGQPQPLPYGSAPSEMYACFVHGLQTVEKERNQHSAGFFSYSLNGEPIRLNGWQGKTGRSDQSGVHGVVGGATPDDVTQTFTTELDCYPNLLATHTVQGN